MKIFEMIVRHERKKKRVVSGDGQQVLRMPVRVPSTGDPLELSVLILGFERSSLGKFLRSADPPIQLATKVPVPVAFNCFRCSLAFESRSSLGERLLIATKPSIPTVVLGNYATPDQALHSL
jgi:hypothetical protein